MLRAVIVSALLAAPAAAQPALPPIVDVTSEIDGREAAVEGLIGIRNGDWWIEAEGGAHYRVALAVDRQMLASLDGCELDYFNARACPVRASAEVDIHGSNIRLIIFEIERQPSP